MFNEEINFNEKPAKLGKVLYRVLNYWYYLPIFFLFSLVVALYIYISTAEQYKIGALLLVKSNNERLTSNGAEEPALPGINLGEINNLENQLIILKSSRQIEKTLKQLNFSTSYYRVGTFKETDIYRDSPFLVKLDTSGIDLPKEKYLLEFVSNYEFILHNEENKKRLGKFKFFQPIKADGLDFVILPQKNSDDGQLKGEIYSFQITPLEDLVNYYQDEIKVSELKPGASIFEISLQENNIQKGKDFINKLAENCGEYTLEKKNRIANNIIRFIESQLISIGDSLNRTKNTLENFKASNEMVDISLQGQMIIERAEALEVEKSNIIRQLDYYQYLVEYLSDNENVFNLLPPSAKGIENTIMDQMIAELTALNAEKESLKFNSKEINPAIAHINRQLNAQKQTILQQAQSNVTSIQKDLDEINQRQMQLSSRIRNLPRKEQASLEIEQKFQTTDQLHTYLMERRSEAQLAKASNVPDNELIERARLIKQTKPDLLLLFIMVMLIGLVFPFAIIFLIIFANNKIQDKEDLEQITTLPIIGVTPKVPQQTDNLNGKSSLILNESIRNIRTALEFFPPQNVSKCILITSGLPSEGKSLSALKLAISYAELGKKTLLIDFDMRKPNLANLLNLKENGYGLSSFLAQQSLDDNQTNKLIYHCKEYKLDVIRSGKVPPNPVELIGSNQTKPLINKLKENYDIIIVDSPPIGLFSDAVLLSRIADINILITRHNATPLPLLKTLLKDSKIGSIKNLCILLNALPVRSLDYNNYCYVSKYYQ